MDSSSNRQSSIINSQLKGVKVASRDLAQMRKDALDIFWAGVQAVEPEAAVKRYCRQEGNRLLVHQSVYNLTEFEHIYVIGAGKAGATMAKAVQETLGERITEGLINVKYGHLAEVSRVRLIEAGHPVPDEAGLEGARAILDLASKAEKGDMVLCVISGGGSALLPLPAEGLSLQDKQDTTRVLLACGATIHEVNSVRKHISRVKGGRLAQATYPATLISLILSDVVGDDLDVIASGPTVSDSSTFQDCMKIFNKYGLFEKVPKAVLSNLECVVAAEIKARSLGYRTLVLSSMIEGETREVACVHAGIAKEILKSGHPLSPPACVLSGGETVVTITGQGLGGRNQEFVLAAAIGLNSLEGVVVLSAGTDGTDGPTDAAGAVADSQTIQRAQALRLDPADYLLNNDTYHFFEKLGDLVKTGPTNTNVMDLRIMLVA